MPKATITFNLPEEKTDYDMANSAGKMYSILWEIDQHCRAILKYGGADGYKYKSVDELAEYIRDMIPYELFEEMWW